MNRLRELRKSKGLTSIETAKILNLSESAVRYIERGERGFSMESLKRACDYFGVSADYMLGKSPDEMLADFVDSLRSDFTVETLHKDGDVTQSLSASVSEPTRTKINILCRVQETQNIELLNVIHSLLRSFGASEAFADTDENRAALSVRLRGIYRLLEILPLLTPDALDVVLQTAVLQKRKSGEA